MPCVLLKLERSVRFGFLGIFPDEISKSGAEHDAKSNNQDSCNNYFVDVHILSPGLALLL